MSLIHEHCKYNQFWKGNSLKIFLRQLPFCCYKTSFDFDENQHRFKRDQYAGNMLEPEFWKKKLQLNKLNKKKYQKHFLNSSSHIPWALASFNSVLIVMKIKWHLMCEMAIAVTVVGDWICSMHKAVISQWFTTALKLCLQWTTIDVRLQAIYTFSIEISTGSLLNKRFYHGVRISLATRTGGLNTVYRQVIM